MKSRTHSFYTGIGVSVLAVLCFVGATVAPAEPPEGAKPDFVIGGIVLDPTPSEPGEAFSATVTVVNAGTAAGDAGIVRVWVNREDEAAAGEFGDAIKTVGQVGVGEVVTVTLGGLTAPAEAGTNIFRAYVDANNATEELNEENNQLWIPYITWAEADPGEPGEPAAAYYKLRVGTRTLVVKHDTQHHAWYLMAEG